MAGYESIKPRANVVMAFLGVIMLVDAVSIAFSVSQVGLLERAAAGYYSDVEANANDQRIGIVNGVYLFMVVATAVAFVGWMAKAHRNLWAFGLRTGFSDSQVKWAFFIPFVNLVRPYQVMKTIWEGSVPVDDKLVGRSAQVLGIWWGTWVIGGLMGRLSNTMGSDHNITALISATHFSIINSAVNMTCAALAIWAVLSITVRQESCASGQVASEFD